MDSGTLSDPAVDSFVRENFIPVRVEKEHDAAAFESLSVTAFPSTIVLRADRSEVMRLEGFLDSQEFVAKLREALGKN